MGDERRAVWTCPECAAEIRGPATAADTICPICEVRPEWEALPEAVRAEIGAMVDEDRWVHAVYRLLELADGTLPNGTCIRMVGYRRNLRNRNASG